MKAITIWQPWASLIACEAKGFETRSWKTDYRGTIAIHAAQKPFDTKMYLDRELHPFAEALNLPDIYSFDKLPYGCVIATAEIVDCLKVVKETWGTVGSGKPWAQLSDGQIIEGSEHYFGDYTLGRYAWELANVRALPEPIPAKGMQGLWSWKGC